MKISDIFEEEPTHPEDGLDLTLWRELKRRFLQIDMPDTPEKLKEFIEREYERATGHPIRYDGENSIKSFHCHHGSLEGIIYPGFWIKFGIPLLLSRHPSVI